MRTGERLPDEVRRAGIRDSHDLMTRGEASLCGTTGSGGWETPVRVITAGKPWLPKPEKNQARREGHEHLAAAVKDGKAFVAERSAHFVPYDQSEIIMTAVAELVRDAGAEPSRTPAGSTR
jgi:hypothetical protein